MYNQTTIDINITQRFYAENQQNIWKFLHTLSASESGSASGLIRSPWPVLILTSLYILTVCLIGPSYMKNRDPFKLKQAIRFYNLVEVFLAAYLFSRMYDAIGNLGNLFDCSKVFSLTDGSSERIYAMARLILIVRLTEYLDTIFFILRKKHNQVTFLHVYHHAFVPMYAYWILRTAPTRFNVYILIINSLIHVIMYSYYFLATFHARDDVYKTQYSRFRNNFLAFMVSKLLPLKIYLTQLQIFQFISMFFYTIWAMTNPTCSIPSKYVAANLYVSLSFLGLFLDFYLRSYRRNRSNRPKQS